MDTATVVSPLFQREANVFLVILTLVVISNAMPYDALDHFHSGVRSWYPLMR